MSADTRPPRGKSFDAGEAVEIVPEPTSHPKWEPAEYIRLAWPGWHSVRSNRSAYTVPSRRIRKAGES